MISIVLISPEKIKRWVTMMPHFVAGPGVSEEDAENREKAAQYCATKLLQDGR